MTRFSKYYERIVCPDLLLKLPITNINQLPHFDKIVLHASSSDIVQDKKQVLPVLAAFEYLTGQKAYLTWSRKSVAAFRLRKNTIIGSYNGNQGSLDIRTSSNNIVLSDGDGNPRVIVNSSGNVGVGTSTPGYKLEVNGSFAAVTKSFVIDHPTKEGMKLRYGSLEGPENGVYVRGRLKDNNTIELPDYWTGLVDEDTITVTLTPIGKHQKLFVEDIADNKVVVGNDNLVLKGINCFYVVWAERKDVAPFDVEYEAE